jgi:hypothetical protein
MNWAVALSSASVPMHSLVWVSRSVDAMNWAVALHCKFSLRPHAQFSLGVQVCGCDEVGCGPKFSLRPHAQFSLGVLRP